MNTVTSDHISLREQNIECLLLQGSNSSYPTENPFVALSTNSSSNTVTPVAPISSSTYMNGSGDDTEPNFPDHGHSTTAITTGQPMTSSSTTALSRTMPGLHLEQIAIIAGAGAAGILLLCIVVLVIMIICFTK